MTAPSPQGPGARLSAYLVTDRRLVPRGDLPALVDRALALAPKGSVAVQLREKDLTSRELLVLARALGEITRARGASLLVNDRIDVALAAGADGVHLAGHSLPPKDARRILGPDLLLGASAHSLEEARRARAAGCDFATFGPVFPTPSKAPLGSPLGLEALEKACAALAPFPLIALGGLDLDSAGACRAAGAAGVAAIRAWLLAPDPAEAVRRLLEAGAPARLE
ncbi:MAG: thiamine phosphate synthase [Polyangia bacterium]|jgi:thiamine-phosphate pyrophosphorylase|nr:thiamine phosphate synthase [Polyangia bacterium]